MAPARSPRLVHAKRRTSQQSSSAATADSGAADVTAVGRGARRLSSPLLQQLLTMRMTLSSRGRKALIIASLNRYKCSEHFGTTYFYLFIFYIQCNQFSTMVLLQRVSIACFAERCISHSKSVRPSVCLSHAGTESKRLKLRSRGIHWRIAPWL